MITQSLSQMSVDLNLLTAVKTGAPRILANYTLLAQERWTWLVSVWDTIYPGLQDRLSGDEVSQRALLRLSNAVLTRKLGADVTPFQTTFQVAQYRSVLSQILLATMELSEAETSYVAREEERVRSLTLDDLVAYRRFCREQISAALQRGGVSSPVAQRALLLPTVPFERDMLVTDYDAVENLNAVMGYLDALILEEKSALSLDPNLMAVANGNMSPGSDVTFPEAAYRTTIERPFSGSLEEMAQVYLGDRTRWYDLVSVNKLRPPYVDDKGTKTPLLAPGAGSDVRVTASLLSICIPGNRVGVGSYTRLEQNRVIEAVRDNQDGTVTVSLSGKQDLAGLLPAQGAFLRVFEPNTLTRGSSVLIPLTVTALFPRQPEARSRAVRELDQALRAFGVDAARDYDTGGLLLGKDGDFQLIFGIPAVRQSLFWFMRTIAGTLASHQTYGIPDRVGDTFLGQSDAATVLSEVVTQSLLQDTRYTSVQVADVSTTPSTVTFTILVRIAGLTEPIPVSFVV